MLLLLIYLKGNKLYEKRENEPDHLLPFDLIFGRGRDLVLHLGRDLVLHLGLDLVHYNYFIDLPLQSNYF
jgi:hypothetical protein